MKKLHTGVISTGVRDNAPPGTPKTGAYALGWGIVQETWADTPSVTHTGSNNMNLALAAFWPDLDFGFVMMTNIAGQGADGAFRKLSEELYKEFAKKSRHTGAW